MTVRDPEVLFELRRDPELLAIADGLGEVLSAGGRPRSARRWWLAGGAAAAAVGAVAAAVLLFAATGVRPDIADRALAAVGDGPVLHIVTRRTVPSTATLLKLSTGRRVTPPPRVLTTEIWLDRERALEHTIVRETGEPTQDTLLTPRGVTSESGPVWTCARIAAHPVEATRAHVSCNVGGENGTKPRHVSEPPPPIDPALAGFVDGYRQALASGAARKIGEGTVHGRRVFWLEFRLPDPDTNPRDPRIDFRERVAVDSETYRPLVIIPVTDGVAAHSGYDVLEIGTVARGDADFSRPKLLRSRAPSSISSRVTDTIDLAQASEVLGGARALWPGPAIGGLKLVAVQRQEVTTGYRRDSGIAPRVTPVITLIYGGVERKHATPGSIEITESTVPFAVWWPDTKPVPDGYLRLARMGWGELRAGGLYLRVTRVPNGVDPTIVAAARRLVPVPGG